MDDLDDYVSFLLPSKRTQATQNDTHPERFNTEVDHDITPWSDAEIPRNFLSLQKVSYTEPKVSSKQKEVSEMYYSSCQPKIFQRPGFQEFYGKKLQRLATEGEKDSTISSESTNLRTSTSHNQRRVLSRQQSKNKSVSSSINPPSRSEKCALIKIEQQAPQTTEKEIDEPLISKEISYETPFDMANSLGTARLELNSRLQKIHQFYFPPAKPLGKQIRKSLTRSKLSVDKSKNMMNQDSSKDLHRNQKALILIKSYRDFRPLSIAESKKTCVYKNLGSPRSKSREHIVLERYATEVPSLNSALTGEKTKLNDFSKKFTPYGNFNLEKRGNFFKEKSIIVKQKDNTNSYDDALRNNLKLKLEILRKIGRKENTQNTSKSRENSVKIRAHQQQPSRPETQNESNLRKASGSGLTTKSASSVLFISKSRKVSKINELYNNEK